MKPKPGLKLLPCPCGMSAGVVGNIYKKWRAYCTVCLNETMSFNSRGAAISYWNRIVNLAAEASGNRRAKSRGK